MFNISFLDVLNNIWPYLVAILLFLILIIIHEFGHFISAKLLGVRVNEFAVGFGPKLIKKKKGETEYSLNLIPLGGYCAMEGEDSSSDDNRAFCNKAPWRRFIIVVMGAVFNLILGLILISVSLIPGDRFTTTTVAEFRENSVSSEYGLMEKDKIVAVDGRRIFSSYDLSYAFTNIEDGTIDITVIRDGKKKQLNDVKFKTSKAEGITYLNIDFYVYGEEKTFGTYVKNVFATATSYCAVIWRSLIDLIAGKYGISAVSGPVGLTSAIGIGCWGYEDSGVPDIRQLETKMYFYYMITRYIDAGYEAFHMGQAEMMMRYDSSNSAHWQTLLDKARAYAKKHARRGVALFDCHTAIDSSGIKVGDRLIFDVQGAGMCPNETSKEKDALKAEVLHYKELVPNRDDGLSWVGRSAGGIHPLGFEIEENFTLIEFDNYGGNGMPGIATPTAFYNWGFDDVTWFATQPEWYRNQFLTETAEYLSNNELCLDTEGKQQYFLQPVTMRVITPGSEEWYPKVTYTMGEKANDEFIFGLIKRENAKYDINNDGTFTITISRNYRANRNSDGCPLGFNQEDTIRKIFLGENAPEDDELLKVVLPKEYGGTEDTVITPSLKEPQKDTANIDNNITSDMPFGTVGTVLMWVLVGIAGVSLICAVVFSIYVFRMNKKKI